MHRPMGFWFAVVFLLLSVQLFPVSKSTAQQLSVFPITDIVAGTVADIQVELRGSSLSNLGWILRVTTTRADTFEIDIPAGLVFSPPASSNMLSAGGNIVASQRAKTIFSTRCRVPGGGRPVPLPKSRHSRYTEEFLIYALCYDVNLPPPDTLTNYLPSLQDVSAVPRFSQMIAGFEKFVQKVDTIQNKIETMQILSDDEARYAAFMDWPDLNNRSMRPTLMKNGLRAGRRLQIFFSYSDKQAYKSVPITSGAEIDRFAAQNVLWTMVPDDQDFSAEGVRADIESALEIDDANRMDAIAKQANALLALLNLQRRLFVIDSLRIPISHNISHPPYFVTAWNGAGGGFAVRMTPPDGPEPGGSKWHVLDLSYFLYAPSAGSFITALLDNANGFPGTDLMPRKPVTFKAIPDGGVLTIDVANDSVLVDGDFHIALFQQQADVPSVVLTEAINGRAASFNGLGWGSEPFSLFFTATVEKINSAPSVPTLVAPAFGERQQADQAVFHWRKAVDPDEGDVVSYYIQFSLYENFDPLLYEVTMHADTAFTFVTLPVAVRNQMENQEVHWRVRAVDHLDLPSAFSPVWRFTLENEVITEIGREIIRAPEHYALYPNYPNPFNPSTVIRFDTPKAGHTTISIYDLMGKKVMTLLDQELAAGRHKMTWDGQAEDGTAVPSAIYFVRMVSGDYAKMIKMTLIQ